MSNMKKVKLHLPENLFTPNQIKRLETSLDIKDNPGDITHAIFQHSVLCAVFFPYRNPGDQKHVWQREYRGRSLALHVKVFEDEITREEINYGLPYGANARLIMAYLNTVAIRQKDPVIPLGKDLNKFLDALGKKNKDKRTRQGIIDQLRRITHSSITVRYSEEHDQSTREVGNSFQLIKGYDLWFPKKKDNQPFLFPSYVQLDNEYFENLCNHAVPLDERAMFALSKDALALDIYAWLAHRLHHLKKPERVLWKSVKDQFGTTYKTMDQFKRRFREKLKKVLALYPHSRVEEEPNKYFMLHPSPPPIHKQQIRVIK